MPAKACDAAEAAGGEGEKKGSAATAAGQPAWAEAGKQAEEVAVNAERYADDYYYSYIDRIVLKVRRRGAVAVALPLCLWEPKLLILLLAPHNGPSDNLTGSYSFCSSRPTPRATRCPRTWLRRRAARWGVTPAMPWLCPPTTRSRGG